MARKMEDSNPQNWNKQPHAQPVEAGEAVQSFFEWMYIALRPYGGLCQILFLSLTQTARTATLEE